MKRWQVTFDRLDALSRTRALSEQESELLEYAIGELDKPEPGARRARDWSDELTAEFRQHVESGCTISEAGRRVGKGAGSAIGRWKRMKAAGLC